VQAARSWWRRSWWWRVVGHFIREQTNERRDHYVRYGQIAAQHGGGKKIIAVVSKLLLRSVVRFF
jgi:hypothetical protein